MNFISYILQNLLVLLIGTPNNPKHDLRKQKTCEDHISNLNRFINMNYYKIALAAIIFGLFIFSLLCYWITGCSTVESGTYYNHIQGVI